MLGFKVHVKEKREVNFLHEKRLSCIARSKLHHFLNLSIIVKSCTTSTLREKSGSSIDRSADMEEEVEEDANSRFVDYTNATTFETFTSDIEDALRQWNLEEKSK